MVNIKFIVLTLTLASFAMVNADSKSISPDTITMHRHWQQKMSSWQSKVDTLKEQNRRLIEDNAALQQQTHEDVMKIQHLTEQNQELKIDVGYLREQNDELRGRSNYLERSVVGNNTTNP